VHKFLVVDHLLSVFVLLHALESLHQGVDLIRAVLMPSRAQEREREKERVYQDERQ
jgi:hypothetical protein